MGTHLRVLSETYAIDTKMNGLDDFQKYVHSCALDESSLSIGRVKGGIFKQIIESLYSNGTDRTLLKAIIHTYMELDVYICNLNIVISYFMREKYCKQKNGCPRCYIQGVQMTPNHPASYNCS